MLLVAAAMKVQEASGLVAAYNNDAELTGAGPRPNTGLRQIHCCQGCQRKPGYEATPVTR